MNKGHEQEKLREERPTNLVVEASKRLIARIESIIRRMLEELNLKGKQAQDWLEDNWQTKVLPTMQRVGAGACIGLMLTSTPVMLNSCDMGTEVGETEVEEPTDDLNTESQEDVGIGTHSFKSELGQMQVGSASYNEICARYQELKENDPDAKFRISLDNYYLNHELGFTEWDVENNVHVKAIVSSGDDVYIFSQANTTDRPDINEKVDGMFWHNLHTLFYFESVPEEVMADLFGEDPVVRYVTANAMVDNLEYEKTEGFAPYDYPLQLHNCDVFGECTNTKSRIIALVPNNQGDVVNWTIVAVDPNSPTKEKKLYQTQTIPTDGFKEFSDEVASVCNGITASDCYDAHEVLEEVVDLDNMFIEKSFGSRYLEEPVTENVVE